MSERRRTPLNRIWFIALSRLLLRLRDRLVV